MIRRLLIAGAACALLLLGNALPHAADEAKLELPDGRVIHGTRLEKQKDAMLLETVFGSLRVPHALLVKPADTSEAKPDDAAPPDRPRITTSEWIKLESDLSASRTRTYHEILDAFVEWMIDIYELDRERVKQRAPFHMLAWRSKDDFKRVQDRVAPGIAAAKGQGFAEGVAGFYDPGSDKLYLWDAQGPWGTHPEVALHETCHLLNKRLAEATGIHFPVWFEEGTATYFETFVPGARAPETNLAALATVLEAVEAGTPMTSGGIRSVGYADFKSYEYAWGWALVHFLRHRKKGKVWPHLLKHLRTVGSGAPSESETRRFLKAVGFKQAEDLDEAWHAHLKELAPEVVAPIGTSEESLDDVRAIEKPTPRQTALFASLGMSFLRKGMPNAAVVYLAAAHRGNGDDPDVCLALAQALAEEAGKPEDVVWPTKARRLIEHAVSLAPLRASARLLLGRQQLLGADAEEDARRALDTLGLALLLRGPDDDDTMIAKWALVAGVEAMPERSPQQVRTWLGERAPEAKAALASAWIYFLQEQEAWELLIEELEGRVKAAAATFEDRKMLAGLYLASDRGEEAAPLYAALLESNPRAYSLWPHYIRSLIAAGRTEDARAAKTAAIKALHASAAPAYLRRAVQRIVVR